MMPALVSGLTPLTQVAMEGGALTMAATQSGGPPQLADVFVPSFQASKTEVTVREYSEYLAGIGENRWTLAVEDYLTGDFAVAARGKSPIEVIGTFSLATQSMTPSPGGRIAMGGLVVFEVTDPMLPLRSHESPGQRMGNLDWWDALAFAAAHGGKLPTEAELMMMHQGLSGDLWIWTTDWDSPSQEGWSRTNPRGPRQGDRRVLRGGSSYADGDTISAADRISAPPTGRDPSFGVSVLWQPARVFAKLESDGGSHGPQ